MVQTMFFVSWYIHNKKTNEWNGTIVDKFSDYSAAKKKYHEQLAMYIDGEDFDSVCVMLTNSLGGVEMSEVWIPNE